MIIEYFITTTTITTTTTTTLITIIYKNLYDTLYNIYVDYSKVLHRYLENGVKCFRTMVFTQMLALNIVTLSVNYFYHIGSAEDLQFTNKGYCFVS